LVSRASAENFPGGGANGKDQKLAKKTKTKIALFSLFQGRGGATEKKTEK